MLLAQGQSVQQAARQIEVTRADLLSLAEGVWWSSGGSGETIESVRAREYPPETSGCRERVGYPNPQRDAGG